MPDTCPACGVPPAFAHHQDCPVGNQSNATAAQMSAAKRYALDERCPPEQGLASALSPGGEPWQSRFETETRAHQETLDLWAADKEVYVKEVDSLNQQLAEAHTKQDSLRATIRALAPFADFFEVIKQITTR